MTETVNLSRGERKAFLMVSFDFLIAFREKGRGEW